MEAITAPGIKKASTKVNMLARITWPSIEEGIQNLRGLVVVEVVYKELAPKQPGLQRPPAPSRSERFLVKVGKTDASIPGWA